MDILLVDKMRPSDAGLMLRVAVDLSYWQLAKLVATVLSSQPNRLQFFRSVMGGGAANTVSPITAPLSVTPSLNNPPSAEVNSSPVGSDLTGGGGSVGSNAGCAVGGPDHVHDSPLLAPQIMAARASGRSSPLRCSRHSNDGRIWVNDPIYSYWVD